MMDVDITELEIEFQKVLIQLANEPFNKELLHKLQLIQKQMLVPSPATTNQSGLDTSYSTASIYEASLSSSSSNLTNVCVPRTLNIDNNENMAANTETPRTNNPTVDPIGSYPDPIGFYWIRVTIRLTDP
ncbi:unnamed protein product [Rotaria sordida]|uniref:Uncharacterized protein n=1 Tax=Rotaria sordida TaxID=392033 RepID=A0A814CEL8_9BILA|nr:unnamed protein product [Rotaria sordida]CAF0941041.1 unnamed protein product [Rotaria sordida]